MELLLCNSNINKNLLGIPYPESLELRKQCRKPFAETVSKAVLIYVQMLKSLELRCNGAHLACAYGCSQCQTGHLGWKVFRIRGKKSPSYKERNDRTEVTENSFGLELHTASLKKQTKKKDACKTTDFCLLHTLTHITKIKCMF